MTVQLAESVGTLLEAPVSSGSKFGKRWRAKVIEAGQGSSAYYPERVLEDYASVFRAGTHVYIDHPTLSEEFERPERSVADLIGKLATDAVYEDGALYAEVEFYERFAPIIMEMAGDVGLSIRALGTAEEGDDGTPILTSFVEVLSVDVVTRAGAGGALIEMLESARPGTPGKTDREAQDISTKENTMTEEQEQLLKQVLESLNSLTPALATIAESMKPADKPEEPETPEVDPLEVADTLAGSGLTEAGRKQVVAAVKGGTPLAEAVKAQQEYETAVAEAAKAATGYSVLNESNEGEPVKVAFTKAGN